MWLLNAKTYELTHFFESERPAYAILSHTWGDGEVTFKDLRESRFQDIPGFRKIQLCSAQALRNGLSWAWVDTCCIDKSSSAELSEAINSMYRWYEQSTICYAFLSDVYKWEMNDDTVNGNQLFIKSRWFTRGWTLQELLAPTRLIFYDADWSEIGDRWSLAPIIEESTGIPVKALEEFEPSEWRVCSKMAWYGRRKTTRIEDCAYSLLGIFEVNMPLLYGEGPRAFERLQEAVFESTKDMTIFSWDDCTQFVPELLAPSPASFENCRGRSFKDSTKTALDVFKESHNPSLNKTGFQFSTELHPCGLNIFWMRISEYRVDRRVSWHPYKYFHDMEEYLCILQISPRVFRRVRLGDSMLFTRRKPQMRPPCFELLHGHKFDILLLGAGNAQSTFTYEHPHVRQVSVKSDFIEISMTPGIFNERLGLQRITPGTSENDGLTEHVIQKHGPYSPEEHHCLFFPGNEKSFKIVFLIERPVILDCDREIVENGFRTSIHDYLRKEKDPILPARNRKRKQPWVLHGFSSSYRNHQQLLDKTSLLSKCIGHATTDGNTFSIKSSINSEFLIAVRKEFAICESRVRYSDDRVKTLVRWIFLNSEACRAAKLV